MGLFKQATTIDRAYGKSSRALHKTAKQKCVDAESKTLYAPKTKPFKAGKVKINLKKAKRIEEYLK